MDKLKKQDDEARKKKQVALILCTETDPHSISGKRQKHFTYGDAHTRAYEHGGWLPVVLTFIYHDCELSGGINHRRTVKYTQLLYNPDGTIQTITP